MERDSCFIITLLEFILLYYNEYNTGLHFLYKAELKICKN